MSQWRQQEWRSSSNWRDSTEWQSSSNWNSRRDENRWRNLRANRTDTNRWDEHSYNPRSWLDESSVTDGVQQWGPTEADDSAQDQNQISDSRLFATQIEIPSAAHPEAISEIASNSSEAVAEGSNYQGDERWRSRAWRSSESEADRRWTWNDAAREATGTEADQWQQNEQGRWRSWPSTQAESVDPWENNDPWMTRYIRRFEPNELGLFDDMRLHPSYQPERRANTQSTDALEVRRSTNELNRAAGTPPVDDIDEDDSEMDGRMRLDEVDWWRYSDDYEAAQRDWEATAIEDEIWSRRDDWDWSPEVLVADAAGVVRQLVRSTGSTSAARAARNPNDVAADQNEEQLRQRQPPQLPQPPQRWGVTPPQLRLVNPWGRPTTLMTDDYDVMFGGIDLPENVRGSGEGREFDSDFDSSSQDPSESSSVYWPTSTFEESPYRAWQMGRQQVRTEFVDLSRERSRPVQPQPAPLPEVDEELMKAKWGRAEFNVFICPITSCVMTDPVIASDGQTYERSAISRWFSRSSKSPVTNMVLSSRRLVPNFLARNLLHSLVDEVLAEGNQGATSSSSSSAPGPCAFVEALPQEATGQAAQPRASLAAPPPPTLDQPRLRTLEQIPAPPLAALPQWLQDWRTAVALNEDQQLLEGSPPYVHPHTYDSGIIGEAVAPFDWSADGGGYQYLVLQQGDIVFRTPHPNQGGGWAYGIRLSQPLRSSAARVAWGPRTPDAQRHISSSPLDQWTRPTATGWFPENYVQFRQSETDAEVAVVRRTFLDSGLGSIDTRPIRSVTVLDTTTGNRIRIRSEAVEGWIDASALALLTDFSSISFAPPVQAEEIS